MSKKATRAVFSAVVIGGALTMLLYTTVSQGAAYYKHVDEVMVEPEAWYGKSLQLHGHAEGIQVRPDTLEYRFQVTAGDYIVQASYTGIVPDTFQDGSEVVLDGRLTPNGFEATRVMAKCPSKYEAAAATPSR
jgi:cytochrome c-type biogenesis protein CcmE